MHFGDELSPPFEHLRIVSDEMYERCLQTIKGRSTHLENRTVPTRTDSRNLLTGLLFCKSCGTRLCYQHNVLRRKLADGTPRVYERHQFRCYRKISSRHSCKGPSSYEADPIIATVESEIRSFLARIHCTPEEKLVSVACSRNAEMYEIAYKQATKAQVDELRTWGEIYDGAKAEVRHMIIARLVDRIDVDEGNKVTIKYRVSFEQFMSKEQATA